MFESMDTDGRKLFADVIFWVISKDVITAEDLIKEFDANDPETVMRLLLTLRSNLGIIQRDIEEQADMNIEMKVPWYVIVSESKDLPIEIMNLLLDNGYTASQVETAFQGLPLDQKKVSSNILTDTTHHWNEFEIVKPELNAPVIVRLIDESQIFIQTRSEVVYVEDIKIASWNGTGWEIIGPHPKYDFSLLSNKEVINSGAKVTHWAFASEEELEGWETRLDPIGTYEHLELKIDSAHEKLVYRSIILAAACLMKESQNYPDGHETKKKLLDAHTVMCDFQSIIDYGIILKSEEGNTNAVDK